MLLNQMLKSILDSIRVLGSAREYFAEDNGYIPLFPDEISLHQSSIKIGRGLLSPPEAALNLFLRGAQVSNQTEQEEICYEFFVEAFTVYEESISESKAQMRALHQIIKSLYKTTIFGYENYDTLTTKCAIHCSRLLKRADQCTGILMVSHLFWADISLTRPDDKPAERNGKRVLECLQKALKIADTVMDQSISVGLFLQVLEKYLWYFEKGNDQVLDIKVDYSKLY